MTIANEEAVRLLNINRLPTEFWKSAFADSPSWHWPSNAEPLALVTYATEPSPETGHVGWCWWAQGRMGEANSYEAACAAAEAALGLSAKVTP